MSEKCPKCGSDRILNGQCLSCGIVVSKYDPSRATAPVSFVAAQMKQAPKNLSVGETAARYVELQKKSRRNVRIVLTLVVCGLILGGYLTYRVLARQAAAVQGFYKDGENLYLLQFPSNGWFRYGKGDLKTLPLKDPLDAFYVGEDPEKPDVVLCVWMEFIERDVHARVGSDRGRTKGIGEDQFYRHMEESGFESSLGPAEDTSYGFYREAESTKDGQNWPTFVASGFNGNRSYLFVAIGTEDKREVHEEEVRKLMRSLGFNMSII